MITCQGDLRSRWHVSDAKESCQFFCALQSASVMKRAARVASWAVGRIPDTTVLVPGTWSEILTPRGRRTPAPGTFSVRMCMSHLIMNFEPIYTQVNNQLWKTLTPTFLLHRHAFGQISGPVHVPAERHRHMICK